MVLNLCNNFVVTVGFAQEYKSEKSLKLLERLVPYTCSCLRNAQKIKLDAAELVPGDIICLNMGDRVPADLRLIEAYDLEVDESSLTGEADAVHKNSHVVKIPDGKTLRRNLDLNERTNIVYMGTLIRNGTGRGVVVSIGEETEIGKVFAIMQDVEEKKSPLQVKMDELGVALTKMSFAIIAVICLLGFIQGKNYLELFTIAVSLAVAAIPEGLPIVVTVTLALGVLRMAKRKAIIRRMPAVEALGAAHVLCVDKTGTITKNELKVVKVFTPQDKIFEVTGEGYSVNGYINKSAQQVHLENYPSLGSLLEAATLCNNAQLVTDGPPLGLPTEIALLVLAEKAGYPDRRGAYLKVKEFPFSHERKWMGVIYEINSVNRIFVKGAVDVVLNKCSTVFYGSELRDITPLLKESLLLETTSLGSLGLRILTFASGTALNSLSFLGFIGMHDPPREQVGHALSCLKSFHVKTIMITGDQKETALKVASDVGIFNCKEDMSLSGAELENLSEEKVSAIVPHVTVYFRMTPRGKLIVVSAFQRLKKIVAMTGDGVNDAPAVKQADIGIAMGSSGTDVCKEAADMILLDDDLSTLVLAVSEGKTIFSNIQNFVRFQLSTSLAALGLVAISSFLGYPNPLNPMQILWINIIMDGPPAQSLGVEPFYSGGLVKPPRSINDPVITRKLFFHVCVSAAFIIAGTLYIFHREIMDTSNVDGSLLKKNDLYYEKYLTPRETTMAFTTFIIFDMFNALSSRSLNHRLIDIGFFTNKAFLYAVGGSLLGQLLVIYFSPLQKIFKTESLSLYDLLLVCAVSSSVFIWDELRKIYRHGKTRQKTMEGP